jgi:hypothetical protein
LAVLNADIRPSNCKRLNFLVEGLQVDCSRRELKSCRWQILLSRLPTLNNYWHTFSDYSPYLPRTNKKGCYVMPDRRLTPRILATELTISNWIQQELFGATQAVRIPQLILGEQAALSPLMKKSGKIDLLEAGLRFLNFDKGTIKEVLGVVETAKNFASSVGDVISAAKTAKLILEHLDVLEAPEDVNLRLDRLEAEMTRLFQEQEYMRQTTETRGWKTVCQTAYSALYQYLRAPSPQNADNLNNVTQDLDQAILAMLDSENWIPFHPQRHSRYRAGWNQLGGRRRPLDNTQDHYVLSNGFTSAPLMNLTPESYLAALSSSSRLDDLAKSSRIWDPSHYVLILIEALRLRLEISTAIEPLYRSTAVYHNTLSEISNALTVFATRWRDNIVVQNPLAGMFRHLSLNFPGLPIGHPVFGHLLLNSRGLPIGAFDPVFGISSESFFRGFYSYCKPGIGARGYDDSDPCQGLPTYITNVEQAIAATLLEHGKAIDRVLRSTGALPLLELASLYQKMANPSTVTQIVDLTSATLHWTRPIDRVLAQLDPKHFWHVGTESIRLEERLAKYARDPQKSYTGDRYATDLGRKFSFNLARRATRSGVQLGFELKIGNKSWNLIEFSKYPPNGTAVDWFPTELIEETVEYQGDICDCVQERHLSLKEEAESAKGDSIRLFSSGELGSRTFVNSRRGRIKFRIKIQIESFPNSHYGTYLGRANVEILPMPDDSSDAAVLGVCVVETILDSNDQELVREADRMAVDLIPSYIVLGKDFFADYDEAYRRMLKAVLELRHQFPLKDLWKNIPTKVDRDPLFNPRIIAQDVDLAAKILDLAAQDPEMSLELGQFVIPR